MAAGKAMGSLGATTRTVDGWVSQRVYEVDSMLQCISQQAYILSILSGMCKTLCSSLVPTVTLFVLQCQLASIYCGVCTLHAGSLSVLRDQMQTQIWQQRAQAVAAARAAAAAAAAATTTAGAAAAAAGGLSSAGVFGLGTEGILLDQQMPAAWASSGAYTSTMWGANSGGPQAAAPQQMSADPNAAPAFAHAGIFAHQPASAATWETFLYPGQRVDQPSEAPYHGF